MYFFGFFFLLFGLIILYNPAFLAYIVAFVFIAIGVQFLVFALYISRLKKEQNSWEKIFSFGNFDIIKKQK